MISMTMSLPTHNLCLLPSVSIYISSADGRKCVRRIIIIMRVHSINQKLVHRRQLYSQFALLIVTVYIVKCQWATAIRLRCLFPPFRWLIYWRAAIHLVTIMTANAQLADYDWTRIDFRLRLTWIIAIADIWHHFNGATKMDGIWLNGVMRHFGPPIMMELEKKWHTFSAETKDFLLL